MQTHGEREWWRTFYDGWYAAARLDRPDRAAVAADTRFLLAHLRVTPGESPARVFDQCCGAGRLALPLARAGLSVIGLDLAAAYIRKAEAAADTERLDARFVVGDAFDVVPAGGPFDAAFCWATSFGASADDRRNARMLRRAFEALRPGARFVLDYPNVPGVFRRFRPELVERYPGPGGDLVVTRAWSADLERGLLVQRWSYRAADGRTATRDGHTRLYLPSDLTRLLEAAGFIDIERFGSTAGEPLDLDSPRCICVATRRDSSP